MGPKVLDVQWSIYFWWLYDGLVQLVHKYVSLQKEGNCTKIVTIIEKTQKKRLILKHTHSKL